MQTAISTEQYLTEIGRAREGISQAAVARFIALLIETAQQGHGIFLIGNGGNATTASHLAHALAKSTCGVQE